MGQRRALLIQRGSEDRKREGLRTCARDFRKTDQPIGIFLCGAKIAPRVEDPALQYTGTISAPWAKLVRRVAFERANVAQRRRHQESGVLPWRHSYGHHRRARPSSPVIAGCGASSGPRTQA